MGDTIERQKGMIAELTQRLEVAEAEARSLRHAAVKAGERAREVTEGAELLVQQCNELEARLRNAQDQRHAAEEARAQAERRAAALQALVAAAQAAQQAAEKDAAACRKRMEPLRAQAERAAAAAEDIAALRVALRDARRARDEAIRRAALEEANASQMQQAHAICAADLAAMRAELEQERAKCVDLDALLRDCRKDVAARQRSVDEMRETVEALTQQLDAATRELEAARKQAAARGVKASEVQQLQRRVREVEAERDEAQRAERRADAKREQCVKRRKLDKEQLARCNSDLGECTRSVHERDRALDVERRKVARYSKDYAQLQRQYSDCLRLLEEERASYDNIVRVLRREIQAIERERDAAIAQWRQAERALAGTSGEREEEGGEEGKPE
jgi:chromosome segregation ATPase